MLWQKFSGDIRALRASRLRATNLGEVPRFSAFITLSIPRRTTASEVIWASTEKAFLFLNGSRSRLIVGQCIFSRRYSTPLFKSICLVEDWQQTHLSAANRWRIAAAHVRGNKPVHYLLRARGRLFVKVSSGCPGSLVH